MNLSKLSNSEKRNLCLWYLKAGFAFLPFVWIVNTIWFFRDAFIVPPFEEQKQIRKYVILSGIGSLLSLVALISWIVCFQLYRVEWGETGDRLSFIIPTGRA